MDSSSYYKYRDAIDGANEVANESPDRCKSLLRRIQAEMVAEYGMNDDDVQTLIRRFRYTYL